jgi:hypothetical protein
MAGDAVKIQILYSLAQCVAVNSTYHGLLGRFVRFLSTLINYTLYKFEVYGELGGIGKEVIVIYFNGPAFSTCTDISGYEHRYLSFIHKIFIIIYNFFRNAYQVVLYI